jgi:hypothetical protein
VSLVEGVDGATLSKICSRDVAALEALIPAAVITPQHHVAQGTAIDSGKLLPGKYDITLNGASSFFAFDFSNDWHVFCSPDYACAVNVTGTTEVTLADGLTAHVETDPRGAAFFLIRQDAKHWSEVGLAHTKELESDPKLNVDMATIARDRRFADMLVADFQDLAAARHTG